MKAFTMGINKADFMKEILAHQAADNFIRKSYDEGAGGCAVGCSLKSVAKIKNIKINVFLLDKYLLQLFCSIKSSKFCIQHTLKFYVSLKLLTLSQIILGVQ